MAMATVEAFKSSPKEECYFLADQIRLSSRLVCANIAESYRKRKLPKHYFSKLNDADSENSETQVWLKFAESCNYSSYEDCDKLLMESREIGKPIQYKNNNPGRFGA